MQVFVRPDFVVSSIHEIPFDELIESGIRLVATDVDNTLVTQGGEVLDRKTLELLTGLTERGIHVVLASNSLRNRQAMASSFGGHFQCPGRSIPRKPHPEFFRCMLKRFSCEPSEAMMIGDKYFYDVNPPRRIGMRAVLVNPLGSDLIGDRILRLRKREDRVLRSIGLQRP